MGRLGCEGDLLDGRGGRHGEDHVVGEGVATPREVWARAWRTSGVDATPQEFRHIYISLMRAAGVHDAELAKIAGRSVQTMFGRYTRPTRESFETVRESSVEVASVSHTIAAWL